MKKLVLILLVAVLAAGACFLFWEEDYYGNMTMEFFGEEYRLELDSVEEMDEGKYLVTYREPEKDYEIAFTVHHNSDRYGNPVFSFSNPCITAGNRSYSVEKSYLFRSDNIVETGHTAYSLYGNINCMMTSSGEKQHLFAKFSFELGKGEWARL